MMWLLHVSTLIVAALFCRPHRAAGESWFECGDGTKIQGTSVCDGRTDCLDKSDEEHCPLSKCQRGFECASDGECLPAGLRCDGRVDCADGSDEDKSSCLTKVDNEKRLSHDRIECRRAGFYCGDGTCVTEPKYVCDGVEDCASGRDEAPQLCGGPRSAQSGNHGELVGPSGGVEGTTLACSDCAHACLAHRGGVGCSCPEGFELAPDGHSCRDIDECAEANVCSQSCENTLGKFVCSCGEDYTLVNGTLCRSAVPAVYIFYRGSSAPAIPSEMFITIGDSGRYVRQEKLPISLVEDADDVARVSGKSRILFDVGRDQLYVRHGDALYKLDLYRRDNVSMGIVLPPHVRVGDFAVDVETRNVYFTDARSRRTISVCSFEKVCSPIVVQHAGPVSELSFAKSFELGPRLYWIETPNLVMSSTPDGRHVKQEYQSADVGGAAVQGYAVDEASNRLYVVETDIVEVDLATGRTRRLFAFGLARPIFWSLTVDQDQLLVQTLSTKRSALAANAATTTTTGDKPVPEFLVYRINRLTGEHEGQMRKPATVQLLAVNGPASARSFEMNPCSANACSHICVPVGVGSLANATCLCPPGMELREGGRSCTTRPDVEEIVHVAGRAVAGYVFAGGILYRQFRMNLPSTPTAIASDNRGTLFHATHRGVFGMSRGARFREYGDRLRSVRTLAFDPVDNVLYAANGRDLVAVFVASGRSSIVRGGIVVNHLDIDPYNRRLLIEGRDGQLSTMPIGNWTLESLGVDVSQTPVGGQKTWTFDPYERRLRLDSSVVLSNGFCDSGAHSAERGFDCEPHGFELRACHDPSHRHDLVTRSGPSPLSLPPSACANSSCVLCVTDMNEEPACLCPYGHVLEADGQTCSEKCQSDLIQCPSSGKCIDLISRCDGLQDCEDGADESHCDSRACTDANAFHCGHGICISAAFRCDGQNDCSDASDELDCPVFGCHENEFRCENGPCVPGHQRCDGVTDCFHGDDELHCESQFYECRHDEFRCGDGHCLPLDHVCDSSPDCTDMSDETNCTYFTKTEKNLDMAIFAMVECDPIRYVCCESGEKLSLNFRCNGFPDCADMGDEENCLKGACLSPNFLCSDGTCLSPDKLCDGLPQCGGNATAADAEDERDCRGRCHEKDLFECVASGRCLPYSMTCDGKRDCAEDGSDETAEHCVQVSASLAMPAASLTLASAATAPLAGGRTATPDTMVLTSSCFSDEYRCADDHCIPLWQLCDNTNQCPDGSDEGDHCDLHECRHNNGGCSHHCHETPEGVRCSCRAGYRLMANGMSCEDINECLDEPSPCPHFCHNLKGNFSCSCASGFFMTPMGACRVERGRPVLLAADHGIVEVVERGNKKTLFEASPGGQIGGIAYEFVTGLVFVSDTDENRVHRIAISSSDHQTFTRLRPGAIAIDWVTENAYFVDALPFIHVCARLMAGAYCTKITRTDVVTPNGIEPGSVDSIVVVPDEGIMFYAEKKSGDIIRLDMDGAHKRVLQLRKSVHGRPRSLTSDLVHRRLFWLDQLTGTIESADFDGRHLRTIIHHLDFVHTFALFEDFIWFPDIRHNTLVVANKRTGAVKSSTRSALGRASLIQILHQVHQPFEMNRCHKHPCQHVCLLRPHGFTCACASGSRISPVDNRTCEWVPLEERPNDKDDEDRAWLEYLKHECGCQNGGQCFAPRAIHYSISNAANTLYCRCPPGFKGARCEIAPPGGILKTVLLVCFSGCLVAAAIVSFLLISSRAQPLWSHPEQEMKSPFETEDWKNLIEVGDR